jgi:hypothetical protein
MLGKRLLTPCRPQFSVTELQKLSRKCPIWGEFKNFGGLGLQPHKCPVFRRSSADADITKGLLAC